MISLEKLLRQYKESDLNYKLPVILGENENGKPEFADLTELKHILITGSPGSGKSVFQHNLISTFLKLFHPDYLKLLLVDMKLTALWVYERSPHLLSPILPKILVNHAGKRYYDKIGIFSALQWLIQERNIRLNKRNLDKEPYIIVVIDTFCDLMFDEIQDFKDQIKELVKKAAEVKIHIILSDSRTSPEVFPNIFLKIFPTKICFNTSSAKASKLFIRTEGGEKLRGAGDMLFLPPNKRKPLRIQTSFISDEEIKNTVKQARSIKVKKIMIFHVFIIHFLFKKYILHIWIRPFWSITWHKGDGKGKLFRIEIDR